MKLKCGCGNWHDLSPTALVIVVTAFLHGDLQKVKSGVSALCYLDAFSSPTMEMIAPTLTSKHIITFDGLTWSVSRMAWTGGEVLSESSGEET